MNDVEERSSYRDGVPSFALDTGQIRRVEKSLNYLAGLTAVQVLCLVT